MPATKGTKGDVGSERLVYYLPDEAPELRERLRPFAQDLRRARRRRGMTQRDLEKAAGLDPHDEVVSALETGLYDPTWTLAVDLAAALGVPLQELGSGQAVKRRRNAA